MRPLSKLLWTLAWWLGALLADIVWYGAWALASLAVVLAVVTFLVPALLLPWLLITGVAWQLFEYSVLRKSLKRRHKGRRDDHGESGEFVGAAIGPPPRGRSGGNEQPFPF